MSATTKLAVDMMSGDNGLRSSLPAVLQLLHEQPDIHFHLVGDAGLLAPELPERHSNRFTLVDVKVVLSPDAELAAVLRDGEVTTVRAALEQLSEADCNAMVSAGNSGALMALGRRHLGMNPAYSRPALCAPIPTLKGYCLALDLGANVDCTAEHLVSFAHMGIGLAKRMGVAKPSVGLLSNGIEKARGNRQIRAARELLETECASHFVGYVEADHVQSGSVDVLVCDGFAGNVLLKAMEGTARYLLQNLDETLSEEQRGLLQSDGYNGAILLGLNGVVIKSHGSADANGFYSALNHALQCLSFQGN